MSEGTTSQKLAGVRAPAGWSAGVGRRLWAELETANKGWSVVWGRRASGAPNIFKGMEGKKGVFINNRNKPVDPLKIEARIEKHFSKLTPAKFKQLMKAQSICC